MSVVLRTVDRWPYIIIHLRQKQSGFFRNVTMASVSLEIQSAFGYVVAVVCLSWVLLNWLSLQVVMARKRYNVKVNDKKNVPLTVTPTIDRIPVATRYASGNCGIWGGGDSGTYF